MGKLAFLFPGQGSQEVGMGADLFKTDPAFRSLVRHGSTVTGEDLEHLCLRGPEKKMRQAKLLQPLLVAVSLGYFHHSLRLGIVPDVVAGHSLGEITALAAAGVITDEQAVTTAAKRGEFMDNAAIHCRGGMLAVMLMSIDKVQELIAQMGAADRIMLANDNAPDQVVLSGDAEQLAALARRIKEARSGKTMMLPVAGPWHSAFMAPAQDRFESWVVPLPLRAPAITVIFTGTGQPETDPAAIKALITAQLTKPVLWRACMETLHRMGVDRLCEAGPGRILSGLARINGFTNRTTLFNLNNLRGVETAAKAFGWESPSSPAAGKSDRAAKTEPYRLPERSVC